MEKWLSDLRDRIEPRRQGETMLRLQWLLSSSLLPPLLNPELSPETSHLCPNRRLCTLNSSRPLLTLTTTRKPSPKCQYSWSTQQQQPPPSEPGSQAHSFSPQTRAGGTSLSLILWVIQSDSRKLMLFGIFGLCWEEI